MFGVKSNRWMRVAAEYRESWVSPPIVRKSQSTSFYITQVCYLSVFGVETMEKMNIGIEYTPD